MLISGRKLPQPVSGITKEDADIEIYKKPQARKRLGFFAVRQTDLPLLRISRM